MNTTANDVLIGQTRTGYFNMGNTFFTGNIDDVRIYDVAILPEQVNNLAGGSDDPSVPVSDNSLNSPDPPASVSTSSSSPRTPHVPDTGYGQPAGTDSLVGVLTIGTIISTSTGLALLYRQKHASRTY